MISFSRAVAALVAAIVLTLAPVATAETSDQIRNAQTMMTELGLYSGPVTGQLDRATSASFTTWLFSHNLPAGTPLNVKTLKLMSEDLGEEDQPKAPPAAPTAEPAARLPGFVLFALSLVLPL